MSVEMGTVIQIAQVGIGLLMLVLLQATFTEGVPFKHLGQRPMGRGLWEWLYHYFVDGVGVLGYDPILGALSPPLRLLVHVAFVNLLWAFILCMSILMNMSSGGLVGTAGVISVTLYSIVMYIVHYQLTPVSQPDGPRPHKIQRYPDWKTGAIPLPKVGFNFVYQQAKTSHATTERRFDGTAAYLSGEATGRDIWTANPGPHKPAGKKRVDESMVQEFASGGRNNFGAFDPHVNPNSCDQIFRAQCIREYLAEGKAPPERKEKPKNVEEAVRRGVHFYSMLQTPDGHFSGDYGGPHFLMPGLIVVWYLMGQPSQMLNSKECHLMKHYIITHQQVDGGWGTHLESPSTMFGSTLMYVALRLLGMPADDPVAEKGRKFLLDNGGATYTASWCKFYLCLLGVMDWQGHNTVPPEMLLLPNWTPFHPGRMWCHARMVYVPMAYLYGVRYVYDKVDSDPLIAALRQELYTEDYDSIPWIQTRHWIAPMDNYSPIPWTMATLQNILAYTYEAPGALLKPLQRWVRPRGVEFCREYMHAEDLQTNYIDIGPVNKVLNMLSAYHAHGKDIHHSNVLNHMARVADYLWVAEDGMKMKGYNGSQCWDTSFAIQAVYEAGLLDEFPSLSEGVWSYLERTQILSTEVSQASPAFKYEDAAFRKQFYRHISQGGWPFSTSAHGWPISDCTGEGLKGVLCLLRSKCIQDGIQDGSLKPIDDKRLHKAVNVLLSYQNEDGGFATYENNRGYGWFESLNPSEVFGDIMIDYSYVECSMASLTALVEFHETYPDHRRVEIQHAVAKGREFLKNLQREDGSWYGSWACCFCYGAWFGIEGLVTCGEPITSPCIVKACEFLLKNQRPNGGWGEDFTACFDKSYPKDGMKAYGDEGSGVVNTAWALMALSAAKYPDTEAVKRGVQYLMQRQLPCGDWPQEGIAGVFNRACGITYTAYRNVFPIWAMGRCRQVYGSKLDD